MMWLLELLFFSIALPSLLFGLILRSMGELIAVVFEPALFLTGVWFGLFGYFLKNHSTPDAEAAFVGLVDVLAQSHLFGVSLHIAVGVVAVAFVFASAYVCRKKRWKQ